MKTSIRIKTFPVLFAVFFITMISTLAAQGTPLPALPPANTASGVANPIDAVSSATGEAPADAVSSATGEAPADAVSGATASLGVPLQPKFLGMNVSVNAHKITGYAAGGLFVAAGVVGAVRFLDLQSRAHAFREGEDSFDDSFDSKCPGIITQEWKKGQELRWTHVGLLIGAESLYLFDGVTGMSMMGKSKSGAGKIHRNAFFVHAGLMLAEIVLGFMETDALQKGDHERLITYGAIHTGIGIAIPLVILGSGLAVDLGPKN